LHRYKYVYNISSLFSLVKELLPYRCRITDVWIKDVG